MSIYARARRAVVSRHLNYAAVISATYIAAVHAARVVTYGPTLVDASLLLLGAWTIYEGAQRMSLEKFHHKLADGREITLPHFKNLPFGVIRKLRKEDEAEQLFGLVEQVADADTLAVIDTLEMADIEAMFASWQKASEITVGESSGSTGS